MSDDVDIGREAVEHLAAEIAAGCAAMDEHGEQRLDPLTAPVAVDPMVLLHASAVLRALLAERDVLRAELADVLAENDAARFQLNNALAALRETGHE